ncbi:hypothetical protein Ahy_B02g058380 [Arachis hypogaea]|uniref:FAR1 domain-containing protein n=1 Tax=Arachis hypogaea TaxID=3818 RepID=A0A445AEH9_ARAHY|nr:hypothetical protein Ahy_B02g058380 [Arachis hypogaea]
MAESGYEMLDEEAGDYGDVLQLSKEEIMNKAFRSDEAAYEFYRRLGKYFGFGIRKGDSGKDESGRVICRRFFCNRAGLRQRHHYDRLDRQRGHRPEMQTNCEAKLSVYLDVVSGIWRVRKIVLDHNHDLTPAYMHEHLTRIPEKLVLKRWHKDAKSLDKYAEITEVGSEIGFLLRHGARHAAAQWMLYVGARSPSSFTQALNGLHTLCQELNRGLENVRQKKALDTVDLHDPVVAKTKGALRVRRQGGRKRRCTRCRKTGHTK